MYRSLKDLPSNYYLILLGVMAELGREDTEIEYLLLHEKKNASYFNIYKSKWRAYLNAIDPRYWSYRTAVFMRPKDILTRELDLSSYT
jgi:hypothetical protein